MKVKFEVEIDIEFDDAANIRSKSDLRDEVEYAIQCRLDSFHLDRWSHKLLSSTVVSELKDKSSKGDLIGIVISAITKKGKRYLGMYPGDMQYSWLSPMELSHFKVFDSISDAENALNGHEFTKEMEWTDGTVGAPDLIYRAGGICKDNTYAQVPIQIEYLYLQQTLIKGKSYEAYLKNKCDGKYKVYFTIPSLGTQYVIIDASSEKEAKDKVINQFKAINKVNKIEKWNEK